MKTIKNKDMKFNKEELEKLSYADLAALEVTYLNGCFITGINGFTDLQKNTISNIMNKKGFKIDLSRFNFGLIRCTKKDRSLNLDMCGAVVERFKRT
jgi:hypothetical protein